MSFIVYFFVLLITVGSVAFGLDWMQAPMSPMPPSKYELRAAKPPEPPKPVVVETKPEAQPVKQQAAAAPPPAPAIAAPAATVAQDTQAAAIVVPETVPQAAATPKCDIAACTRAYHSFTPSDCTYQPSDGPRRLCTKGTPPSAAEAAPPASSPAVPDARAQASCNIAACSQAYISFKAADCTYQPLEGPRQLCTK
jgi:hypothetical protein